MFETHREQLLQSLDAAHTAYYKAEVFGGPSLHFHIRALQAGKDGDCTWFAESTYAVLTAWGMHRMGPGGSKMRDFEDFRDSLQPLWPAVLALQQANPDDLDENDWKDLHKIFCGIRCMATGTSLVGNSKVVAHAIPNLVPPVDREYTLNFLFGNPNITNNLDQEWKKLELILRDFFYPVVKSKRFQSKAALWLQEPDVYRWDTSPLKIADNVLIGFVRQERAKARAL